MKLILIRKLARALNGIDLSACNEGDILEMSNQDAQLLLAEGWAVPVVEERPAAHDRSPRTRSKQQR